MRVLLLTGVLVMLLAADSWAKSTFFAPSVEYAMPMGTGSLSTT